MRAHRISKLLPFRHRLTADRAGGIHSILGVNGLNDFRNRESKFRQLIRLDPNAHRVLARAENRNARDPLHACELVVQINVRVIGEKDVVVAALRRIQGEHDQRRGCRFLHRDAELVYVLRQLRTRLIAPHLGEDLVLVHIRADFKVDR